MAGKKGKKEKDKIEIIVDPKDNIGLISLDDNSSGYRIQDPMSRYFSFYDLQEQKTDDNRDAIIAELEGLFKNMEFDVTPIPVIKEKIIIHRIPTDNIEEAMKVFEKVLRSCGINLFKKKEGEEIG